MKALITGSSGFIGSHLVTALLNRGYEVVGMIRKTSNTQWLNDLKITLLTVDYQDIGSLKQAVDGVDYIFHLGAVIDACDWDTYYRANTISTHNLLKACTEINLNLKKFIFVSSIAASGPSEKGILKVESDKCCPIGPYGKSKLLAEKICNEFKTRIPIVIIRPPNVLGIRQKDLYVVLKIVKKCILPMLGNSRKQTSICFIQDLVEALILAAENERANGETYFVTGKHLYSWYEMLHFIAQTLGVMPSAVKIHFPVLYIISWLSEFIAKLSNTSPIISQQKILNSRKYYFLYSGTKIQRELGFEPKVQFEQGMREIINWYLKNNLL